MAVEGERPSALQYTGEHWDGDVGLLYLRARWYDPAIGRFLSEDPFPGFAALPQTQHAYVYVGNNPINLTDPSGQNPLLIGALAGAAIGGAIGAVAGWTGYVLANPGGRPEDYLASHDFWRAGRVGLASGAVAGAVTGALGPLLLPATGTLLGSIIVSAELGGLGGALGRITSNLLTPCTPWYDGVPETVAVSIVIGGVLGGAGYGIKQLLIQRAAQQAVNSAPRITHGTVGEYLEALHEPSTMAQVPRGKISAQIMADLHTASDGDEFALLRTFGRRIIVRGRGSRVGIPEGTTRVIAHTHGWAQPYASGHDAATLQSLGQQWSLIITEYGRVIRFMADQTSETIGHLW
ncbi:MAG: RHS repeat-associated core domain-containing protein [Aestuariibacter sp.]|nr:RHS repeat-associated core domain-containing protein [Aestuariibacter sp.]